MEQWVDIKGYEGLYQVSNLGRIKSIRFRRKKVLRQQKGATGYLIITLSCKGQLKTKQVHQLVAIAFLNHIPCKFEKVVNHKNTIKTDNRADNLEIVTNRKNCDQSHLSSSSKFVGVSWNKVNKKWTASIKVKGKTKQLGYFDDEKEASEYYKKAVIAIENGENIEVKSAKFSSVYKGITWNKKNSNWMVRLRIDGKTKYLGSFETEEKAKNYIDNFNL